MLQDGVLQDSVSRGGVLWDGGLLREGVLQDAVIRAVPAHPIPSLDSPNSSSSMMHRDLSTDGDARGQASDASPCGRRYTRVCESTAVARTH